MELQDSCVTWMTRTGRFVFVALLRLRDFSQQTLFRILAVGFNIVALLEVVDPFIPNSSAAFQARRVTKQVSAILQLCLFLLFDDVINFFCVILFSIAIAFDGAYNHYSGIPYHCSLEYANRCDPGTGSLIPATPRR
jgi:hypothetical protein